MSTRYVYSVYNTTVAEKEEAKIIYFEKKDEYPFTYAIACNNYEQTVKMNRSGESVTFYDLPGGSSDSDRIYPFDYVVDTDEDYRRDTLKYKYVIVARTTQDRTVVDECYLLEPIQGVSGGFWHIITLRISGRGHIYVGNSTSSSDYKDNSDFIKNGSKEFYKNGGIITKGSTILKTASSRTSLKTGAFSESGSWRWRTYKGSDTIDPTAVAYSKAELQGGESVTVRASARTPTYGGTVYYQYQYSANGGSSWTNLGSRTTSTSASLTIPEGAEQFQARVLASDGWGFTSTTYVAGPALSVSQLKAYIGVGGKARAVQKIYVGVNGKAREVVRGYVGVQGKGRKFL